MTCGQAPNKQKPFRADAEGFAASQSYLLAPEMLNWLWVVNHAEELLRRFPRLAQVSDLPTRAGD